MQQILLKEKLRMGRSRDSVEMVQSGSKRIFSRLDDLGIGNYHSVEFSVQVVLPESEKFRKHWELGRLIEILPDIALQNVLVVGHPIENFSGRDAVVAQLCDKIPVHKNPRSLPYISKNHSK